MAFNTNILKSNTAKQIFGAVAGMAIAGLLYVAVDQASYLNIKGLLVSSNTVSENAGQVNINTANVDEATQRQLAARANAVAGQLQSSASAASSSQIAETPLSEHVEARRAQRVFVNQLAVASQDAKTYSNDPNKVISVQERVGIRAARIANLPAPSYAPQALGVGEGGSSAASAIEAIAPVTVVDIPQVHPAAMTQEPQSTQLPNSGLGLNILVTLSLLCAFFSVKTGMRDRVIALALRPL